MEKILEIKEGYGPWLRLEDDTWHNLCITDMGNIYFNGELIHNHKNKKIKGCKYEGIENRFDILDL